MSARWTQEYLCARTGKPVTLLDEVASTNPVAKALPVGTVVVASRQTAGYGRRKRAFSSEEGGLYFSYKVAPDLPLARVNLITLAAGVAVVKGLEAYGVRARLKYPNDVWVDGKKICGILTECVLARGRVDSAVIGVGLNVKNTLPAELQGIATTLSAHVDAPLSRGELLASVCEGIDGLLRSPDRIAPLYRACDALVGREIVLKTDGGETPCVYGGIDGDGVMYATRGDERICVTVGEVTVRPKAEANDRRSL